MAPTRTDPPAPPREQNTVAALRERVRRLPGGFLAWRIGVTVLGLAIIAVGIVLLPLPGPGWLIIFAGLGLLATEYEWAARLLRYARDEVKRWTAAGPSARCGCPGPVRPADLALGWPSPAWRGRSIAEPTV